MLPRSRLPARLRARALRAVVRGLGLPHTNRGADRPGEKAFPDTTIIFNHLGGRRVVRQYTGRRDQVFAAWKSAVAELARCPNVVAKVGGIQMVLNGYGWHERKQPPTSDELLAANRDWYLYLIDRFTPARCMFESNFLVDRLSCSYTVLWNQFKKLTKDFSASDRSAMFHDTASVYIGFPEHDVGDMVRVPTVAVCVTIWRRMWRKRQTSRIQCDHLAPALAGNDAPTGRPTAAHGHSSSSPRRSSRLPTRRSRRFEIATIGRSRTCRRPAEHAGSRHVRRR